MVRVLDRGDAVPDPVAQQLQAVCIDQGKSENLERWMGGLKRIFRSPTQISWKLNVPPRSESST